MDAKKEKEETMSDTAARARELAEIRAMSNEDLMSKFRTEPSDKWFDYREELLKRLAAQSAAPVEEVAREIVYERSANSDTSANVFVAGVATETKGTTEALTIYAGKLVRLIKDEDVNRAIYMLTNELRQHGYGAQGQGVGSRFLDWVREKYPVLQNPILLNYGDSLTSLNMKGIDCATIVEEYAAQFFSPVPSPESATPETVTRIRNADLIIPSKPPLRTPENDVDHPEHKTVCADLQQGKECSHKHKRPWKKA